MSNQIIISSGAKVRSLEGVLTGTSGVVDALGINVPSGIPQLDSNGKILVDQLPNSVMEFKGTWNVSTNTPYLVNGVGNAGDVYLVEGAATGGTSHDFGAGAITFYNGDQVVYSGSTWERASGSSGTVTSVAITESGDALNITGSPITNSGTINIGFNGTSGQYINGEGNLTTFPSLTGYVPYTGATSNVNLGTNSITADYFQASLTPSSTTTAAGKMVWDSTYNTLAIGLNSNVAGLSGLSTFYYIKATSAITKGQVIMFTGSVGASGVVTGATATGVTDGSYIMGIAAEDIALNGFGYVQATGPLKGIDTSMFTDGQILWYNPSVAGGLTATQPTAPNIKVQMAAVINSGAGGSGSIQIRVSAGSVLGGTDSNVQFSTLSNGDIIKYNGTYWTNVAGTTSNISEGSNLYFTDARARGAISLTTNNATGAATYNSTTGVLNIPNYSAAGYVPYIGATASLDLGTNAVTAFGVNIYGSPANDIGGAINIRKYSSTWSLGSGDNISLYATTGNALVMQTGSRIAYLDFNSVSTSTPRTYTFPNATGTLALTSDIPSLANYVTTNTLQTITGIKNFTNEQLFGNGIALTGGFISYEDSGFNLTLNTNTLTANRNVFLQDGSGTLAFTSDLSAYLPLTGGSLSGGLSVGTNLTVGNVLFGNSAQFSNAVTASAYYLNGMTAGSGALYWTSNRVTLANYNSGGSLEFEVNGGSSALTLASTGAATFSSSVTATQGTFSSTAGNQIIAYYDASNYANIQHNGIYTKASTLLLGTSLTTDGIAVVDGKVGIGTRSPNNYGNTTTTIASTSASSVSALVIRNSDSTLRGHFYSDGTNGYMVLGSATNSPLTFVTNDTERMRITSSGNVGIGTTSPAIYGGWTGLDVRGGNGGHIIVANTADTNRGEIVTDGNGFNITALTNNAMLFKTNNTERMRIFSNGDVSIGTTSNPGKFTVKTTQPQWAIVVDQDNPGTQYFQIFRYNTSSIGYISGNNSNVSYSTSSDYRLKQDLKDFNGLSLVNQIKTYDFEWKLDKSRMYGVIAHELFEILPYAVVGEKDGEMTQAVDYSKIVPVLVKAIQEQQQQIEELKALINK